MKGLAGKIVLVTGATGLIGGAIARRFAAEGATVAVASRQKKKALNWIESVGNESASRLVPVELDLASAASIRDAIEHLGATIGWPDVVIANASRREDLSRPMNELMHADFGRLFETDVGGHYLCARHWAESLREGHKASLIFLSSIYAEAGVDHSLYSPAMSPAPPQYAAVKAGVDGLVRYLAALWGSRGVRVNAVVAGGVRSAARQPEDFAARYARKTMLGRMAEPEEIAGVVAFLASDDATYITGECLKVDGGFCAW